MQVDEIVAAVEAGELDGSLDPIATAIVNRTRSGAVQMAWRLRYDGDEWTQESVTLGELKFAESVATVTQMVGSRPVRRSALMWEIDPRGNAEHAVALIVAHFHKAQGVPLADAVKRAESINATDLVGIIGEYEVIQSPKGDGTSDQSTSAPPTA